MCTESVFLSMHVCACVFTCMFARTYVQHSPCACAFIDAAVTCVFTRMFLCVHTCVFMGMHVFKCLYVCFVRSYVFVYLCMLFCVARVCVCIGVCTCALRAGEAAVFLLGMMKLVVFVHDSSRSLSGSCCLPQRAGTPSASSALRCSVLHLQGLAASQQALRMVSKKLMPPEHWGLQSLLPTPFTDIMSQEA